MMIFRGSILFLLSICTLLPLSALQIAKDGKSSYVIALPSAASAVEKSAAKELQEHLFKVTDALLPIVRETSVNGTPAFFIGNTALFNKHFSGNAEIKKLDAVAIKSDGDNIILGGHKQRGPLYAVYEFLEKYAGIRWWTSTESRIPVNRDFSVDVKDFIYVPVLEYREVYSLDAKKEKFASRLKSNGFWTQLTANYGGRLSVYGWCHTFEQIMPPAKYFKNHPEWFSLVNGKRIGNGGQLCLTNNEMRKKFLELTLEKIKRNPSLWQMSVSQNDYHNWCECDKCMALQKKEGSPTGPLLDFVNYIARGVDKVYPGFPVSTLAYQQSRRVPKTIKPEDNVCIWLCNIENNFGESMEDGKSNADFRRDIEAWSKISKQLFIWNYTAFFGNYMVPHPNHASIGKDIRYFVKMKARGIFPQGDFYCNIGDFAALRAYVMGKMLWNPELDERAVTMEFLQGYYGKAAPYLMEYLDFICKTAKDSGTYVSCYKHMHSFDWFTEDVCRKCYDLFDKAAKAAAEDPLFSERVRRERLSLDTLYLNILPAKIRDAKRLNKPMPAFGPDFLKLADEYVQLINRYQPQKLSLGKNFSQTHYMMRSDILNAVNGSVPPECRNIPGDRWVCYEEGSFTLLRDRALGDITTDPAAANGSALKLAADHCQWATWLPLHGLAEKKYTNNIAEIKKYTIYIYVRAEGNADFGNAMYFGVYSQNRGQTQISRPVSLMECRGKEYKIFSLPAMKLDNDIAIWFTPGNRPQSELNSIYIDRITLIRDE